MSCVTNGASELADRVRIALTSRDLNGFGVLLSDDVRRGDDDSPRACHGRVEVFATFQRLVDEGAEADITDVIAGANGIVCGFAVRWPTFWDHPRDRRIFPVYFVRDGLIVEIHPYDSRDQAIAAAASTSTLTLSVMLTVGNAPLPRSGIATHSERTNCEASVR